MADNTVLRYPMAPLLPHGHQNARESLLTLTRHAGKIRHWLTSQERDPSRLGEEINQLLGSSLLHLEHFSAPEQQSGGLDSTFIERLLDISFHMMHSHQLQGAQLQQLQQLLDEHLPEASATPPGTN